MTAVNDADAWSTPSEASSRAEYSCSTVILSACGTPNGSIS
ncbi:Uncharacterised protein [Mycobacteroides abscessus subsp. abscessus]|nr:Uncharacterised protein [Mycobacteroides abscessus subsp. abscessus]